MQARVLSGFLRQSCHIQDNADPLGRIAIPMPCIEVHQCFATTSFPIDISKLKDSELENIRFGSTESATLICCNISYHLYCTFCITLFSDKMYVLKSPKGSEILTLTILYFYEY